MRKLAIHEVDGKVQFHAVLEVRAVFCARSVVSLRGGKGVGGCRVLWREPAVADVYHEYGLCSPRPSLSLYANDTLCAWPACSRPPPPLPTSQALCRLVTGNIALPTNLLVTQELEQKRRRVIKTAPSSARVSVQERMAAELLQSVVRCVSLCARPEHPC